MDEANDDRRTLPNLAVARAARDMTQEHLAKACGLNEKTVRRAEAGHPVSDETRMALKAVLGKALDTRQIDDHAVRASVPTAVWTSPRPVLVGMAVLTALALGLCGWSMTRARPSPATLVLQARLGDLAFRIDVLDLNGVVAGAPADGQATVMPSDAAVALVRNALGSGTKVFSTQGVVRGGDTAAIYQVKNHRGYAQRDRKPCREGDFDAKSECIVAAAYEVGTSVVADASRDGAVVRLLVDRLKGEPDGSRRAVVESTGTSAVMTRRDDAWVARDGARLYVVTTPANGS